MFICRICGNTSYSEVFGGVYKCDGCTVIFTDVPSFSQEVTNEDDIPPNEEHKPLMGENGPLRFVDDKPKPLVVEGSTVFSDVGTI